MPVMGASVCKVADLQRAGLNALRKNFYEFVIIEAEKPKKNHQIDILYYGNNNNYRGFGEEISGIYGFEWHKYDYVSGYRTKDHSIVLMPNHNLWWWPEVVYR